MTRFASDTVPIQKRFPDLPSRCLEMAYGTNVRCCLPAGHADRHQSSNSLVDWRNESEPESRTVCDDIALSVLLYQRVRRYEHTNPGLHRIFATALAALETIEPEIT